MDVQYRVQKVQDIQLVGKVVRLFWLLHILLFKHYFKMDEIYFLSLLYTLINNVIK